jgi:hypothetical protein
MAASMSSMSRVIDQDLSHHPRHARDEVNQRQAPVEPAALVERARHRFVDHLGRPERVALALALHDACGNPAQARIDLFEVSPAVAAAVVARKFVWLRHVVSPARLVLSDPQPIFAQACDPGKRPTVAAGAGPLQTHDYGKDHCHVPRHARITPADVRHGDGLRRDAQR